MEPGRPGPAPPNPETGRKGVEVGVEGIICLWKRAREQDYQSSLKPNGGVIWKEVVYDGARTMSSGTTPLTCSLQAKRKNLHTYGHYLVSGWQFHQIALNMYILPLKSTVAVTGFLYFDTYSHKTSWRFVEIFILLLRRVFAHFLPWLRVRRLAPKSCCMLPCYCDTCPVINVITGVSHSGQLFTTET